MGAMDLVKVPACVAVLAVSCWLAYTFRLHAVNLYGRVIHEFDPWFNYRAAQYLADNGWHKFFHWYDYQSWYPLGRPVGTTIYPGMQITAVWIWEALKAAGPEWEMSVMDVCVFMPAWFGVVATLFLGLLALECSGGCVGSGAAAALVMAVIPAHMMRSPAGKYDNECIAMTAMCATYWTWTRALRTTSSWPMGAVTGLCYIYMVAAWGGYIFVVNLIGLHAAVLVAAGRFSPSLHKAYSLWYVIGTAGAVYVPPVGWAPVRSLEQMMPLGVFVGMQLLAYCDMVRRSRGLDDEGLKQLRVKTFGAAAAAAAVVVVLLMPTGYFGPLSSRVRSLFVPHTRTGNPLVDSVAEHQATSPKAYWTYFHLMNYAAPIGFVIIASSLANGGKRANAKIFAITYATISYYFSTKMNRLVLLMGPIVSVLGGIALYQGCIWALGQLVKIKDQLMEGEAEKPDKRETSTKKPAKETKESKGKRASGKSKGSSERGPLAEIKKSFDDMDRKVHIQKVFAVFLLVTFPFYCSDFYAHCDQMAHAVSNPSIIKVHWGQDGKPIFIDDYREAYWWLRDNTPEDSRVLSWWDYGYQITGIGNRTTLADGNTWNHEHIATLGKCLTSPERKSHKIIRHIADYVLVWAGNSGDDLAKSPHMARICNSVYTTHCSGDPTCSQYSFTDYQKRTPTPMMAASLLYKLHGHNQVPGVHINETLWQESFTSKHGLVRIYKVRHVDKESRAWAADPANRKCDAPGSWYCEGQYPPALGWLLKERKDFKQLEDFNQKGDAEAEAYQREYHRRMSGGQ